MIESEAKKLEVRTEWNGKANVCVHCGSVPETFYVATGHDHTDWDIRWCPCRAPAKTEAELLRVEIALLKQKLEGEKYAAQNYRTDAIEASNQRDKLLVALEKAKQKMEAATQCHPAATVHLISEAFDVIDSAIEQSK